MRKDVWRKIAKLEPNLLIAHAREASVGPPSINKNNHPFVNTDRTIAVVHNGRIPDPEYSALRKKYEINSECDSEILLRIFENENGDKLAGVKDIWSFFSRKYGHNTLSIPAMAVAIGERLSEGVRRLWLFRNDLRTLWLVDLRESLGQIFFCSTEEIWHQAIASSPAAKFLRRNTIKLIELLPEEIWSMKISPSCPTITEENLQKFEVKIGDYEPWNHKGDCLKINRSTSNPDVITVLNENDELTYEKPRLLPVPFDSFKTDGGPALALCNEISNTILDIETLVQNSADSLSPREFGDLIHDLEETKNDLQGTLRILQR